MMMVQKFAGFGISGCDHVIVDDDDDDNGGDHNCCDDSGDGGGLITAKCVKGSA